MQNKRVILAARPKGMLAHECFDIQNQTIPTLEKGHFLVKNHIISLDPAIRGWMNEGTTYIPGIPLDDVIRAFAGGEIVASEHADFKVGDWVVGLFGAQQFAVSNGKGVSKVDLALGQLSWHLGVLGMPGMTAYFGLLAKGKPKKGQTVFISGAAGIVGVTVGQIAKIKGCRVVGTAGTDEKCRFLTEKLGFDAAINYKTENVAAKIAEHCPQKIDVFYDNVGGEILDIGLANLAYGARVVICGAISQYNAVEIYGPKNYMKIVTARGHITGIIVFDYLKDYPKAVAQIARWIKQGKMQTLEDTYEGLENFPDVLMKLYQGDNFGKLLLKIDLD